MRRRILGLLAAFGLLCAPVAAQTVPPNPVGLGVLSRAAIVSTSPQTCTSVYVYPTHGLQIVNASAAQTAVLSVYDEPAGATCAAADLVFTVTLTQNQIVTLGPTAMQPGTYPLGFTRGVAYTLSAAATGTISLFPF